jgi:predicted enzyme related to lactoylglutathione lyase
VTLLTGGLRLESDESKRWTFPFIYIHTPDIDAAAEKIKANGGAVIKEKYLMPGVGYAADVKDTEGNQFFLYREL